MSKINTYYNSSLIDQIRKELKGQLGDNLTDLIETLIDEKIKIGYENAEKKFLIYLSKKKNF
jgi:hypothetical protein